MGESHCKDAFIDWPIPTPTYVFQVKRNLFFQEEGEPLSDVAERLRAFLASLHRHGDPLEFGWFKVPGDNGFAILGHTQALNDRGEEIPDPLTHPPPFLSLRYARALLFGEYTHYRVVLFVVAENVRTSDEATTPSANPLSPPLCGYPEPPGDKLKSLKATPIHHIRLYVYELERGTRGDFAFTPRSSAAFSGSTHVAILGMTSIVE